MVLKESDLWLIKVSKYVDIRIKIKIKSRKKISTRVKSNCAPNLLHDSMYILLDKNLLLETGKN